MRAINKISYNKSISLVFLILSFAIVLSTFALLYTFVKNSVTEQYKNQILEGNQISAVNAAKFLDQSLLTNSTVIFGVEGAFHQVIDFNGENVNAYFADVLKENEYIKSVDILDNQGNIIFTYPSNELKLELNRSNETYFIDLQERDVEDYLWTSPYISNLDDELVTTIAYKSEEFIVLGNISLNFFEELNDEIKESSPNKELMLVDHHGIYIYEPENDLQESRQIFPHFQEMIAGKEIVKINDVESIISYSLSNENGWYIIIYEDYNVALSASNNFFNIILFFTIFILVVFLGAFFHAMSIVQSHLKEIYVSLVDVSKGNYGKTIKTASYKEFNKISHEFNNMSQSLYISNKKLSDMAYVDDLTKLQSRNYAREYFNERIRKSNSYMISFFYIDLRRFHIINESYGYEFGDKLLVEIARRIKEFLDPSFKIMRIESDEFLFIYESEAKPDFKKLSKQINSVFYESFSINQIEVYLDISIGIASYPNHARSFDDLITSCLVALANAKKHPDQNYYLFMNSLINDFERKVAIERSIDEAFVNNQFYVVYQPIVDVKNDCIRGFEALSRWEHPTLHNIGPGEYVPLLEQTSKIHRLDKLTIKEAIKTNKQLSKKYQENFMISCNVSVETLMRSDFIEFIKGTLSKHNYDPHYLELEITESTIIYDFEKVSKIMNELKSIGVHFSEDDFGDGYSSLTYLAKLDIDTLKISKNFLDDITTNINNKLILSTIINLSKELGFNTIAEGVETEEILSVIMELECTYVQGYYFFYPQRYQDLIQTLDKKIG